MKRVPPAPEVRWFGTISREEILTVLRKARLRTTTRQIARWHRNGLLPVPERRSLGRNRGMETRYPAYAAAQAVAAAQMLRRFRDFPTVRWVLWNYGFPGLTKRIRQDLADHVGRSEHRVRTSGTGPRSQQTSLVDYLRESAHVGPIWKQIRKTITRARSDAVAILLQDILLGRLTKDTIAEYALRAVRDAMDASQLFASAPKRSLSDLREALGLLSAELNLRKIQKAVRAADDRRLRTLQEEVAAIWKLILLELPVTLPEQWTPIPPEELFLIWFSLRTVSPVLEGARTLELPPILGLDIEIPPVARMLMARGWDPLDPQQSLALARERLAAHAEETPRTTRGH